MSFVAIIFNPKKAIGFSDGLVLQPNHKMSETKAAKIEKITQNFMVGGTGNTCVYRIVICELRKIFSDVRQELKPSDYRPILSQIFELLNSIDNSEQAHNRFIMAFKYNGELFGLTFTYFGENNSETSIEDPIKIKESQFWPLFPPLDTETEEGLRKKLNPLAKRSLEAGETQRTLLVGKMVSLVASKSETVNEVVHQETIFV